MNWFAIGGAVAVLFYGFIFAIAFRKSMVAGIKQVMSLRRGTLGALAILAIVASVNAQKPGDGGGTNEMNNAGMDLGDDGTNMMMCAGRSILKKTSLPVSLRDSSLLGKSVQLRSAAPTNVTYTVTPEEVARGYRLLYETKDVNIVYTMPTNATLLGSVHYVGGHSDFGDHVIDLGNWAFPMGTNGLSYTRLWWRLNGALRYAPHETQSEICAASADQDYYTVPGESQVWVAETENNTRTLEWDHLIATFDDGTNEVTTTTNNCKIVLKENGDFETWFNDYKSLYAYVPPNDWDGDGVPNDDDCYPWDGTLGLAMWSGSLSCSSVVILGGDMGSVTASLTPTSTNAVYGTLRMDATSKVNLWADTNKTVAVTLPMTLTPNSTIHFYVEGVDQSDYLEDVRFYLDVTVGEEEWTFLRPVTVASVKELEMTCDRAGTSPNPPPFAAGTYYPFREWVNPDPDKHMVIPYWNVIDTNDMSIVDYAVNMRLVLEPDVTPYDDFAEWVWMSALPQPSGEFRVTGNLSTEFRKPDKGGVYRFKVRFGGSDWTYGNVVLPLSGSSVDALVVDDVARVQNFLDRAQIKYPSRENYSALKGIEWFYARGRGDYIGRADRVSSPTVWCHNEVNDTSGLGPCCTWMGYPIRNAKLSNFLIAYASQKIGVSEEDMATARQWLRTDDDESALVSWSAGVALAAGADYETCVSNMLHSAFISCEPKAANLWPNLPALGNAYEGMPPRYGYLPNEYFYSPAFLFRNP